MMNYCAYLFISTIGICVCVVSVVCVCCVFVLRDAVCVTCV
jgi:hypothetical protein